MASSDTDPLASAIAHIQHWTRQADEIRFLTRHQPLTAMSPPDSHGSALLDNIAAAAASGDLDDAVYLVRHGPVSNPLKSRKARQAAQRIVEFRDSMIRGHWDERLDSLQEQYRQNALAQRDRLRSHLEAVAHSRRQVQLLLRRAEHLPLQPGYAMEHHEQVHVDRILGLLTECAEGAVALLDSRFCRLHDCTRHHAQAARLDQEITDQRLASSLDVIAKMNVEVTAEYTAELASVSEAVTACESGIRLADRIRTLAEHMPADDSSPLRGNDYAVIAKMTELSDDTLAVARTLTLESCDAGTCHSAHHAAAAVVEHRRSCTKEGSDRAIDEVHSRLEGMREKDLARLRGAIAEEHAWREAAHGVEHVTCHLPLPSDARTDLADSDLFDSVAGLSDRTLDVAGSLRLDDCMGGGCSEKHAAIHEVFEHHANALRRGIPEAAQKAVRSTEGLHDDQLSRVRRILDEERAWKASAVRLLHLEAHMPIPGPGLVSDAERTACGVLAGISATTLDTAATLSVELCAAGDCDAPHAAVREAVAHHQHCEHIRAGSTVEQAVTRLRRINRTQYSTLNTATGNLRRWTSTADRTLFRAAHMPLGSAARISPDEYAALTSLRSADTVDLGHAEELSTVLCAADKCGLAHKSVTRVLESYRAAEKLGTEGTVVTVAQRVDAQWSYEHDTLDAVLTHADEWNRLIAAILHMSQNMPLTPLAERPAEVDGAIDLLWSDRSVTHAVEALRDGALCGADACGEAHRVAATVAAVHADDRHQHAKDHLLHSFDALELQQGQEQSRVTEAVSGIRECYGLAVRIRSADESLVFSEATSLTADEQALVVPLFEWMNSDGAPAIALLDQPDDGRISRARRTAAATAVCEYWDRLIDRGIDTALAELAASIDARVRVDRKRLSALLDDACAIEADTAAISEALLAARDTVQEYRRPVIKSMHRYVTGGQNEGDASPSAYRLLVLQTGNAPFVSALDLLAITNAPGRRLADVQALTTQTQKFRSDVARHFDDELRCRRSNKCAARHAAFRTYEHLLERRSPDIARLREALEPRRPSYSFLADQDTALCRRLGIDGDAVEVLPGPEALSLGEPCETLLAAPDAAAQAMQKARSTAKQIHRAEVRRQLRGMDLELLRKASESGGLRLAALEQQGLHNVGDVYEAVTQRALHPAPGLGQRSVQSVAQAALRLHEAVREDTPIRIDLKKKPARTRKLLLALCKWDAYRRLNVTDELRATAQAFRDVTADRDDVTCVVVIAEGDASDRPLPYRDILVPGIRKIAPLDDDADVWKDFLSRPADYYGLITELGFITEDEKNMHGDLPVEIIEAVRGLTLSRDYLTASLRTYQAFAAKFALVQRKVIIGDEMGLGKTVEALAAMAHLRAKGHSHFIVVCPSAVIGNWARETRKHTTLDASLLYGPLHERNATCRRWRIRGGVGITSFDMLKWLWPRIGGLEIGCAVFDEAHYIKNPNAKRSLASAALIDETEYAILMTGTPLENSVQEFQNLISYFAPDLAHSAPDYLPSAFRKHVAPAYLRRNQEDVLTELPEKVETEHWLDMTASDRSEYRAAVVAGNFMQMRRAAMLSDSSSKVDRLIEIVEESADNGRSIIVYSYFRDVLDRVEWEFSQRRLRVFGPLTGSMQAVKRQLLVDDFSEAGGGAVLLAQIGAGGVGLNIQAASVIVICEPQVKPTMEAQAIARAHRMGQTETVQVHRLLTEDSVDERVVDILADKRQLFDEFARDSVIAKSAPDSVDVSETEMARIIVAEERKRLLRGDEAVAR